MFFGFVDFGEIVNDVCGFGYCRVVIVYQWYKVIGKLCQILYCDIGLFVLCIVFVCVD